MPVIWVTKHALSKGIQTFDDATIEEVDARTHSKRVARVIIDGKRVTFINQEWHLTRVEAVKRADKMRCDELKHHRWAIERLERMTFAEKGAP